MSNLNEDCLLHFLQKGMAPIDPTLKLPVNLVKPERFPHMVKLNGTRPHWGGALGQGLNPAMSNPLIH